MKDKDMVNKPVLLKLTKLDEDEKKELAKYMLNNWNNSFNISDLYDEIFKYLNDIEKYRFTSTPSLQACNILKTFER